MRNFIAIAAVAAALSACAMTVDTLNYANFGNNGVNLVVERRTERDPIMLMDSTADMDRVYAINRENRDYCIQAVYRSGYTRSWLVPANSEKLLMNNRMVDVARWNARPLTSSPNCEVWDD